jgi:hypothetical protein
MADSSSFAPRSRSAKLKTETKIKKSSAIGGFRNFDF